MGLYLTWWKSLRKLEIFNFEDIYSFKATLREYLHRDYTWLRTYTVEELTEYLVGGIGSTW